MVGKERARFEDEWRALEPRLHGFLAKRNVPPSSRDDLVQETALRLIRIWPQVDGDRDLFPLAATIAKNLLIDSTRQLSRREIGGEVPDSPSFEDVERTVLSRLDLAKVASTLPQLGDSQRRALLQIVGGEQVPPQTSATKMLRLRQARRRLAHLTGVASAAISAFLWRVARGVEGQSAPIASTAVVATLAVFSAQPASQSQVAPQRDGARIVVAPLRNVDTDLVAHVERPSHGERVSSSLVALSAPADELPVSHDDQADQVRDAETKPKEPVDNDNDPVEADGGITISVGDSTVLIRGTEDGADVCITIQTGDDCKDGG